ncbi:MAG: class I SAM-dependent methyltransferase [Deltaproteobacteria bacterium]|nr:class I SAM-dependent methyltransferase [Deltaproteobacteria bacterium]
MTSFAEYSTFYDLFYRDKDYAGEARYISSLINRYRRRAESILEMGCGTAAHAVHLAEAGFRIHGIDRSAAMLAVARQRLKDLPQESAERISLSRGDIRRYRSRKRFDAVIALFHVMSYQRSNADLMGAFGTARRHLEPDGIFIFDAWYGPAVLTERPEVRRRRFEDDSRIVTRIAEPFLHPNENIVEVHYRISAEDKQKGSTAQFEESHFMRYLFHPEVALMSASSGFDLTAAFAWLTDRKPGFDSWYACFVCRKHKDGSPS